MVALETALDGRTALVSLSHTAFKSGFTYDLARVTELAHDIGATYRTLGRTVSEADICAFVNLCGFNEPLFMDMEYVAKARGTLTAICDQPLPRVADKLVGLGYTNVRKYREGIQDWVEAGLSTESGEYVTA